MPKKGYFLSLLLFLPISFLVYLSFFGMHLIFIFQLWGFGLFPVTNLLYLDLKHNFKKKKKQKMMYREKKIRKKKHFIMSQYLQEKV